MITMSPHRKGNSSSHSDRILGVRLGAFCSFGRTDGHRLLARPSPVTMIPRLAPVIPDSVPSRQMSAIEFAQGSSDWLRKDRRFHTWGTIFLPTQMTLKTGPRVVPSLLSSA
eukprot:s472_g18.t1